MTLAPRRPFMHQVRCGRETRLAACHRPGHRSRGRGLLHHREPALSPRDAQRTRPNRTCSTYSRFGRTPPRERPDHLCGDLPVAPRGVVGDQTGEASVGARAFQDIGWLNALRASVVRRRNKVKSASAQPRQHLEPVVPVPVVPVAAGEDRQGRRRAVAGEEERPEPRPLKDVHELVADDRVGQRTPGEDGCRRRATAPA